MKDRAHDAAPKTAGKPGRPATPHVASAAPLLLGLQDRLGNRALAALVQRGALRPKLQVSSAADPAEREADRIATAVTAMSLPPVQRKCACDGGPPCASCQEKLLRKGTGAPAETAADAADKAELLGGAGRPLDAATRAFFEPRFGRDFGHVRIHDDDRAAESAQALSAEAYTIGSDIAFGKDRYAPHASSGRTLIAHELAHVAQRSAAPAIIHRQDTPPGGKPPDAPAPVTSSGVAGVGSGQVVGQVPRPPGLPMDKGFQLVPLPDLPPEVAAQIPEGKLATLQVAPNAAQGLLGRPGLREGLAGASLRGLQVTGSYLDQFGFAAAGPDAIGMVGFPRMFTAGQLLPESLSTWGHTAVYVRQGGVIRVIRGYTPSSLLDTVMNYGGVRSGRVGVPAEISNDVGMLHGMFRNTGSRSIEWPVNPETAEAMLRGLPEAGPAPGGGLYSAVPQGGVRSCGPNCVVWAEGQAESGLGGQFGPLTPEGRLPTSPSALGEGMRPGGAPLEGSQGRLYNWTGEQMTGEPGLVGVNTETGARVVATIGEDGKLVVNALPEVATGAPVVGQMARGMQVLRWGGRVFLVIGVAAGVYEVATAKEGEKLRTAVGVGGGFAGGFAAGAALGLFCGPGAIVCSVVTGLIGGVIGGIAGRAGAEAIYDKAAEEAPGFLDTLGRMMFQARNPWGVPGPR